MSRITDKRPGGRRSRIRQWLRDEAQAYFFDLDGCIHSGRTLADKANQLIAMLRSLDKRIAFVTNNSRENGEEIRRKLRDIGFHIADEPIVCATEAAADYLAERYGPLAVKAAGSASLRRELTRAGHRVLAWDDGAADAVVLGRDTEFDYGRLQRIVGEAVRGARLVSTNDDAAHPGEDGTPVPETGALRAAVEAAAGAAAIFENVGKPETYLFEAAMRRVGVSAEACVMVGDNPATDLVGAARAGMKSVWIRQAASVRTDEAALNALPAAVRPVLIVDRLADLCGWLAADQ